MPQQTKYPCDCEEEWQGGRCGARLNNRNHAAKHKKYHCKPWAARRAAEQQGASAAAQPSIAALPADELQRLFQFGPIGQQQPAPDHRVEAGTPGAAAAQPHQPQHRADLSPGPGGSPADDGHAADSWLDTAAEHLLQRLRSAFVTADAGEDGLQQGVGDGGCGGGCDGGAECAGCPECHAGIQWEVSA